MGGENGKRKTSYERYFEGYSQRPVLDKAGNVRMIPVYTAPYWMLDARKTVRGSEERYWLCC